jgi:hypothetical protein
MRIAKIGTGYVGLFSIDRRSVEPVYRRLRSVG